MRPLSLAFPHGAPALGLLLIRLVIGIALLSYAMKSFMGLGTFTVGILAVALGAGALGIGALLGLWTPVTGTLVALFSTGLAIAWPAVRWYFGATGVLGLALALLGPGIWSMDAHLLGWRRLDARD